MTMRQSLRWLLTLAASHAIATLAVASPLVVTDDLGRHIVLPQAPRRIISLEPSVTEELYAVGAGKRIVADDLYSDYPPAAAELPHVNGLGPSREFVLGLRPDIIILFDQTFTIRKADSWSTMYGAPVYIENAGTYARVEEDIDRLGQLVGSSIAAKETIASMNRTLAVVESAVKGQSKPRVFDVVWDHPLMTAGKGTFIDNLITLSGGIDVASANVSGFPTYSPERLIADNPDFILTGTRSLKTVKQTLPALNALGLRAESSGNSYAIPDDWTVRPGPRLSLGLLAIAHVLHPGAFKP
jgi:iron complex transport system substrate-binding protein